MASYERKLQKSQRVKSKVVLIKHPYVSRNHCRDCQRWYFREYKREAKMSNIASVVNGSWT